MSSDLEKWAFVFYLVSIVFGVLFFGAVHAWVYTLVFLMVLMASLMLLKRDVVRRDGAWHFRWVGTDLTPLFLAFFAFLLIQMLPLPPGLLKAISPEAKVDADMAVPAVEALNPAALKGYWHALVPYVYPVRLSLLRWLAYGFFFFGLARTLNSRRRIETAVVVILLLGCFEALYGIMETYSGRNHIWWFKRLDAKSVSGTYINRNHFAGFMAMGIVLSVAYAAALGGRAGRSGRPSRRSLKKWFLAVFTGDSRVLKRFLILFVGAVMGAGLILSGSRGGIIAAVGALFLMGLFFVARRGERRRGLVIVVLLGITMMYGLYSGLDYAVGRFMSFEQSMEDRTVLAERTVALFKEYPVFGMGLGNFRYASGRYQDAAHKNFLIDYAHNDYAQFLAEAGATGVILLAAGLFWYLGRTFRQWRRRHDPFALSLGVAPFGALFAMAIHSWSDFNLHMPANVMVLAAIIAMGSAALHLENKGRHSSMSHPLRLFPLRRAGLVILIGSAGLILWTGLGSVRHFLAEANCTSELNSTLNLEINPPADRVRKAMSLSGGNAEYPFKLARSLMKERDEKMAPPNPDQEGWKRSHGPIISALERAIFLNPLNPEYHIRLGWEYSYLWDRPDYRTKWLPAADISMDRASYVAGNWAWNPKLLYDLGNYWTMRSKNLGPEDPKSETAWQKALWHYRKAMELEGLKTPPKQVQDYIRNIFPEKLTE